MACSEGAIKQTLGKVWRCKNGRWIAMTPSQQRTYKKQMRDIKKGK